MSNMHPRTRDLLEIVTPPKTKIPVPTKLERFDLYLRSVGKKNVLKRLKYANYNSQGTPGGTTLPQEDNLDSVPLPV